MANNPYSGLLSVMQEQGGKNNPPSICLGEVISALPDFRIKTNDLILDKDDILINDILIDDYEREFEEESKGTIKINNQAPFTSNYESTGSTKVKYKSCLNVGDMLALIPTENRQQYIVLCKVVNL